MTLARRSARAWWQTKSLRPSFDCDEAKEGETVGMLMDEAHDVVDFSVETGHGRIALRLAVLVNERHLTWLWIVVERVAGGEGR